MKLFTLQKFSILAVVFIAMACAKEKTEISSQNYLVNDEQLVNQVNWFMDAANDVKEGRCFKSGEKMYLDSALYYIGSTLNYKYGFSTEPFNRLSLDTVCVNIPFIAAEGKTYVVDALQCYNLTIDQLRLKYQNISSSKKFLIGCIIQNAGMANDSSIIVRVIGQFGSGQPSAPITPDDEYWWVRDSYQCDGTGVEGAPNRIDADINFAKRPAPAPGYRVVFTDLTCDPNTFIDPSIYRTPGDVLDNFCDYKLYYATSQVGTLTSEVGCLGEDAAHPGIDEMIFYRDGMNEVLSNWLTTHNRDFFSVYTYSIGAGTYNVWKHWPWLTHGIKHIVQVDPSNPYPINIQD